MTKVGDLAKIVQELYWYGFKNRLGSVSLRNHIILICKIEPACHQPGAGVKVTEFILLTHPCMPLVESYALYPYEIVPL